MLQLLAGNTGRNRVARGARWHRRARQRTDHRRAGQSAAPQDRARPGQSGLSADRKRARLSACSSTPDGGGGARRTPLVPAPAAAAGGAGPRGPSPTSCPSASIPAPLLIVVVPMVLLQCVIAYFFMERHWQSVTFRLSTALTQDIAALIELHSSMPTRKTDDAILQRIAFERLGARRRLPAGAAAAARAAQAVLPAARPLAFQRDPQADRPAVLDRHRRPLQPASRSASSSSDTVLRVLARRKRAYASNSHIFILWMVGTSVVLLAVAIAVPAQPDPADPAACGRGREPRQGAVDRVSAERRARGAAGRLCLPRDEAPDRARHGAAHHDAERRQPRPAHGADALQAVAGAPGRRARQRGHAQGHRRDGPDARGLSGLRAGRRGRSSASTDMRALLDELKSDAERHGHATRIDVAGETAVIVRPDAFKRCLANLVGNAQRYGDRIQLEATRDARFLTDPCRR